MLIGGQWVEAASGKKFDTYNPATGEVLARVPEGDREDIDRAVKAARKSKDPYLIHILAAIFLEISRRPFRR